MKPIYFYLHIQSFYASVECIERNLEPCETHLVLIDPTESEKSLFFAASPAIEQLGIPSSGLLQEIPESIQYIVVQAQKKRYMQYAAKLYQFLLQFVASADMYVDSCDAIFIDATSYLSLYKKTPKQLAHVLIEQLYDKMHLQAAIGIGTNLFLTKTAEEQMKKQSQDAIGVLTETLFRQCIWHHQPITDLWMIDQAMADRLAILGIYDLYGVAHTGNQSIYALLGVEAKLLIEHAQGKDPRTIQALKAGIPNV